nr:hypothetical protein [Erysipelotrichaceae bacterium]
MKRKTNWKRLLITALCMVMMLIAPKTALADEAEESERSEPREVEIELGNIEFTENLTMHELTSIN